MYYRGAAAAILVYDITRASTFRTLQTWVEELRSKGPKDIALAIAGNKADLEENRVRCLYVSIVIEIFALRLFIFRR
jgi:Ras-related protein Rab-22